MSEDYNKNTIGSSLPCSNQVIRCYKVSKYLKSQFISSYSFHCTINVYTHVNFHDREACLSISISILHMRQFVIHCVT